MKYFATVVRSNFLFSMHLIFWMCYLCMMFWYNRFTYGAGLPALMPLPLYLMAFYGIVFTGRLLWKRKMWSAAGFFFAMAGMILPISYCYLYLLLPLLGLQVHSGHMDFHWSAFAVAVYWGCLKFIFYGFFAVGIEVFLDKCGLLLHSEKENDRLKVGLSGAQLSAHTQFDLLSKLQEKLYFDLDRFRDHIIWTAEVNAYIAKNMFTKLVPLSMELEQTRRLAAMLISGASGTELEWLRLHGEPGDLCVPPMSIVCIVENMSKYADLRESGNIGLEIYCGRHELTISAWNRFGGRRAGRSLGLGNKILADRLSHIFGDCFDYRTQKVDSIYSVEITLHYHEAKQ